VNKNLLCDFVLWFGLREKGREGENAKSRKSRGQDERTKLFPFTLSFLFDTL